MKKFLYLLCVFIICSAFNCEDEPLQGEFVTADAACNQAQIDAANAALVLLNATDENYTVICNQYKDALEVQIAVCGDETGAIQSLIDQLGDCSPPVDNSNACQDAIIAKNEAEVAFNNSTDQNYNELCNELKDAIQLVIDTCGTTIELENQFNALGNCILTTNPTANGEISVTTGTLNIVFDEITIEEDGTTLQVSGSTSAANNYTIYFEVEEGATGMNLIDGTFEITTTSTFVPDPNGFSPFTSNITNNDPNFLVGTFSGDVINNQNANLSLTSGMIDLEY